MRAARNRGLNVAQPLHEVIDDIDDIHLIFMWQGLKKRGIIARNKAGLMEKIFVPDVM